jgi:hypothetical protein
MATVTPNFNWPVPTSTDLVKDGATAIEALGDSIDASLVDLKGGTTGQVLAKASGTDMDFNWVAQDDSNAIQNSIVDAKGDLIAASANDTPARLAVGANGETLVADSSTSTGLSYQANWAAGKNKIINGDMRVNQRAFTSTTTAGTFIYDRWKTNCNTGTVTYSAQEFTPGTAPIAGYELKDYLRIAVSGQSGAGAFAILEQYIEDVRTFAGQTVTLSFFARATSGTPSIAFTFDQDFKTATPTVTVNGDKKPISTTWARYSFTVNIPSISGASINNSTSYLLMRIWLSAGSDFNVRTNSLGVQNSTFEITGVQVEAGSVATAFQTATGTLQGELAACQRYFQSLNGSWGSYGATSSILANYYRHQTQMRVTPTITVTTAPSYTNASALTNDENSVTGSRFYATVTSTGGGFATNFIYSASAEL